MYRYVTGDDRDQILGIQGLISDSYVEQYNLPKLMPHSSILAFGFARHTLLEVNGGLNNGSRESTRKSVHNLFSTVMRGLDKAPTQEIVTKATLLGEIMTIELLTLGSKMHSDRTYAYNYLLEAVGRGHKVTQRVPHLSIGWVPFDTDRETKDQMVQDANKYLGKYLGQLTINLGSPTRDVRLLEKAVDYAS